MKRSISKVAVLGSGIMGSRIACHFANSGVEVLLLDIVSPADPRDRNRLVNESLQTALKSNPSPIYSKRFSGRIKTGNFEDDLKEIIACDWLLEAVVEKAEIKKQLFEKVELYRKPGTLVTTNTSGIPIKTLMEGRSVDFRKHFCGAHFFNPPRYLSLLEIIPSPETDPAIIEFLTDYGDRYLGKMTVLCKDTPAFISNRIGVYGIMALFHLMEENGLTVEEVDKLTGPVLGRPKSATFRTCDVVGIDTLLHVANGLKDNCPQDESRDVFTPPAYVKTMVQKGWLGDKTKQGFYKKIKENGESKILSLDLKTLEYAPQKKTKFPTLEQTKPIADLRERMRVLLNGKDKAGEFYRRAFYGLFHYVSNRIPEIADELYKIDEAVKAGFGWELGPFEAWDSAGLKESISAMEASGRKPAAWVHDMLQGGHEFFYIMENGTKKYYDIHSKTYKEIPGVKTFIFLDHIRPKHTLWKNSGCTITDIGDGIINAEFHTKMNIIGGEIIQGLHKAVDIAEKDFRGLVISNEGQHFSAGANVGMIFMFAVEQEYDELDLAVRAFQNVNMRLRYSSVPVIAAPHNLTLGGGCEVCLHTDKIVAHAETYMGLVEFGVGLIPAGGGTKEFVVRLSDEIREGDIEINLLRNRFLTIGQAKVSTSAEEAFELGFLRRGHDRVVINRKRLLSEAKTEAVRMAEAGYTKPQQRKNIRALGNQGLGLIYVGADSMLAGNYISEHDKKIAGKLGYILCGGNLSQPTEVSEQYLLDLEREAFLSLCTERKTLERMEQLIKTGKILRN